MLPDNVLQYYQQAVLVSVIVIGFSVNILTCSGMTLNHQLVEYLKPVLVLNLEFKSYEEDLLIIICLHNLYHI